MDLFSTNSLVAVVQELRRPESFLLDTFFPGVIEDPSDEIHFDIDKSKPRITPFVSPLVAGKVVASRGFATKSFKPAYAKDKRVFQPNGPLKRAMGEKIGGSLSPQQRLEMRLASELMDQTEMLTRREIVMASEALRLGQVTVTGEGFETVVVDFGRDAGLTVTLTGNDCWSADHADSNPLDDIENWAILMQDIAGVVLDDVVMAPDAWKGMRKRLIARDELKMITDFLRTGNSTLQMAPGNGKKARQVGQLGTINLWVYDEAYTDESGSTQRMMPSGSVVCASRDLEGNRCYAAIQDEKAGYTASRLFTKSWLEEDPAVRWLLLQSAPLVVPFRVNASLGASVL